MTNLKKKRTYSNQIKKAVVRHDRIVMPESFCKGRRNPRPNWNIKMGDEVIVLSGSSKGIITKVIKVIPREGMVVLEGVNIKKRHIKLPNQEKGEIREIPAPMHICKVSLVAEVNGKKVASRIRRNAEGKRVTVKSGQVID